MRNYAKDRDKFCDFSLVNNPKINKKGDFYAMNQKKGLHRNMFILAQSAAAMFQKKSHFSLEIEYSREIPPILI